MSKLFQFTKMQVFVLIAAVALVILVVKVVSVAERTPPVVSFEEGFDIGNLGLSPFGVTVSDEGTGLSNVRVYLLDGFGESVLFEKDYEKGTKKDVLEIRINPSELGIKSGPSEFFVEASDYFMDGLLSPNRTVFSAEVTLDFVPPRVEELSPMQYITHGGAGVVVYRVSEDAVESGVEVKGNFFRGYGGYFGDPGIFVSFFAYPHDAGKDEDVSIYARDRAGNERRTSVAYGLSGASYVTDTIAVSDWFMRKKVLPLFEEVYGPPAESEDGGGEPDFRQAFLRVNGELRASNDGKIREIGQKSAGEILWKGKFNQLSNSKVEATFADRRNYEMDGEIVDRQYHLGYDLSVTSRYRVGASNAGVVVFAGDLGIYGSTVMIDHGMGLMTIYSHLSSIAVAEGDAVEKNQVVGKTGTTGLAVGDHLHFGVYVGGVAVRPLEWWDARWIDANIWRKINYVKRNFDARGTSP